MPQDDAIASSIRSSLRTHGCILMAHGAGVAAIVYAAWGPAPLAQFAAILALAIMVSVFAASMFLHRIAEKRVRAQRAMYHQAQSSKLQIEELFAMTDMLQAAEDHEDAGAVLLATARRLLPDYGGALYVFNNSRDRLDLAKSWNTNNGFTPAEALQPGQCWALKRGKPHINDAGVGTLCCMHDTGTAATVEVPMMARGQVHGLLILATQDKDAFATLLGVRRVARALADSMSLALSNISLREKLRTQSLRDPLTGLYNRRYMEDALDRYISLGERTGSATSVVMIDLDNFKDLNDAHGHAKGDAVLRDVAAQLVTALRPADVVARYGGEELIVILPNCGLEDAALKAEMLRMRIESLSDAHGAPVTASFGVASVPETSTGAADVIPVADGALYAAKKAGKNMIACAERRAGRDERGNPPRLTVTS
jgi:diguanylate cyclase (GGDEF)-like protein